MTHPPAGGMYPPPPGQPGFDPATVALHTRRSNRRLTIILSAIVAILALVLGVGALKLYQDRTGNILIPALSLRAADDPGPDPFTPSVSLAHGVGPLKNKERGAAHQGVRVVNGTDPSLYGTTGTAACDTAALGNYLSANPAAAQAWASVYGIAASDIPWYLNTLSPVVLTADTWVTNHAFRGGRAVPFQSVLQAGTPVYVDAAGVPRAVCACGNPLLPPASAPVGGYRVVGAPWPEYHTRQVVRVSYHDQRVTKVGGTTTIVNGPAARPTTLSVDNLVSRVVEALKVGGGLDLPARPADVTLPDPFTQNAAPAFAGPAAAENGLRPDSTEAAAEVASRAAENGGEPPVEGADPAGPDGATPSTQASSGTSVPSSQAPSPTDFGTSTGDAIGALTFVSGGTDVTCTLPSTFDGGEVDATCTDGVSRAFTAADLTAERVRTAVAADPDRVWRVTPVGDTEALAVTDATWQTLSAPSTTTAPTTPTTPTTQTPTSTETTPATTETTPPSTTTGSATTTPSS